MGWTDPRTWTDAEFVQAAHMNPHVRDNFRALGPVHRKMKETDEIVNNSAVLQNDNDFFFPVAINEKWAVDLTLRVDTTAAADLKYNWTVPASTTYRFTTTYAATATVVDWQSTDFTIAATTSAEIALHIKTFFVVSGTAGTVQFQWAQGTATVVDTRIKIGSFMIAERCNVA